LALAEQRDEDERMTRETGMALAVQAALDRCVAAGSPGAIVSIDAPSLGIAFSGASGLFARGQSRALRPQDPFRAASVTKAVTAATAVRLAAQGRWCLDSPLRAFLPSNILEVLRSLEGLSTLETLTIRRSLNHTSGIPDYFFDERFQARVRADPNRMWHPPELVEAALKAKRLVFLPGSDFSYGDTGYVLVGLAIEQLTELPLAEAYRSLIFTPLGMDATYLEWHEPARSSDVSHHYDGDRDLLLLNTSFDWAGGGLVTTAADLVRFLRGLFDKALFEQRWLDELTTWRDQLRWSSDSSARYLRYGLGIGANLACGEEIIGATGVWGAFAYYWPAGDAAIAGTCVAQTVHHCSIQSSVRFRGSTGLAQLSLPIHRDGISDGAVQQPLAGDAPLGPLGADQVHELVKFFNLRGSLWFVKSSRAPSSSRQTAAYRRFLATPPRRCSRPRSRS
jgi:D-alanyl-D-alanine carboxypeptidase